ncbi:MAG: nuclear transport factor 2 family protein [Desulfobacteraceae bacterium]|nr:nuclear transport factor 2 family protein [Desulfobacteraceae bacterium]
MVLKRSVMLMFIAFFAFASPALAKQKGEGPDANIKAVIQKHNQALNSHDLKAVMETYATGPNAVLVGTGPGEFYMGEEAIGGAYNQFFTRFEPNTLHFKLDTIATGSRNGVAWFAASTSIEGSVQNEKKERAFNISGTLEKVKGKWRIVSLHFSRLGVEAQSGEAPK